MTNASESIGQTFAAAFPRRSRSRLVPFLPAGYPNTATTVACLKELEQSGATVIEIGFPFSDPIADGPVIQEAFTVALAAKIKVADVFRAAAEARKAIKTPLVAMVSYSIVFKYGVEKFSKDARAAGFDGLIIPDLPPPEAQRVTGLVRQAGLDTILLVAPTTAPQRRAEIAGLSSGFVYYLSVSGITGEREQAAGGSRRQRSASLKSLTKVPVCVGFGIHQSQHLKQLAEVADGAIVGTAYVRRIKQILDKSPAEIAKVVGQYTRELLADVR